MDPTKELPYSLRVYFEELDKTEGAIMGTMKLREWLIRLRQSVRQWLGTDDLPSATMLRALDAAQKARQAKLLDALGRIEKRLIVAHVEPTRANSFAPPVLDWDLVQVMAMKALEESQPTET